MELFGTMLNKAGRWVTINGTHVFVNSGESVETALARHYNDVANKNEDVKNKQIARNKKEADRLSGKKQKEDDIDFEKFKTREKQLKEWYAEGTISKATYDRQMKGLKDDVEKAKRLLKK